MRLWRKENRMAFEDYKDPEESGSGAENEKAPNVVSYREELEKMEKRIEELQAKGSALSERETAELYEIIAREEEIIAAYKQYDHGAEDENEEDKLPEVSAEVAELMRRGEPYTPEEKEVMEAEAKRLEEKANEIIKSIGEDYEIGGDAEMEE